MSSRCSLMYFVASCLFLNSAGCSSSDRPDIGEVTGKVTIDGQPLAAAGLKFIIPGFRSSVGFTDKQGNYELSYLRGVKGAVVGKHRVEIDRLPALSGKVASLPAKYNGKSELTADVLPGENQIDFALTSK